MLSIVDLKRELGKNIYIYPVHIESIKSNSIDSFSKSSFYNSLNKDSVLQISYYFYTVFYDIILTPILLILNDLERPKTAFISYFFYLCKEKMLEK